MLTPSGGIVRTNHEHTCVECRRDLTNVTRYPGPIRFRCHNRACALCELPPVLESPRIPTGSVLGLWS